MIITERDIFDFVYDKSGLSAEKSNYIKQNYTLFNDLITLYESCKSIINNPLPPIAESAFNAFMTERRPVELYPFQINTAREKRMRLAADSVNMNKEVKAVSFTDNDAKLIIRALFFQDKTELFVLTANDQKLENFSVLTKPSQKEYYFKDNRQSVVTNEKLIEQIDIVYH